MARLLILDDKKKVDMELNTKAKVEMPISINVERQLRQKRSEKYLEQCKVLDEQGCTLSKEYVESVVNEIKNSFEELSVPFEEMPKALIAKCFLGEDYEVHTLDLIGNIVKHYRRHEKLDSLLERARNIAQNKKYACIEVYSSCLRAIDHKGNVSEIRS